MNEDVNPLDIFCDDPPLKIDIKDEQPICPYCGNILFGNLSDLSPKFKEEHTECPVCHSKFLW